MYYSQAYWKGSDIALKAFSLAAEKIPNLRLIAFGMEEPSPELPLPPNSEYVKPEDPEAMAKAIEFICGLPNPDWQGMSEAAYAKAIVYTWDDATERFEGALKAAMSKSTQKERAKAKLKPRIQVQW
ncbi:MAG: glycosyltransferase [Microcoleus sp.]